MATMPVELPASLVERLDLVAALAAEIDQPMSYLPSRVVEHVAAEAGVGFAAAVPAHAVERVPAEPPAGACVTKAAPCRYPPAPCPTLKGRGILCATVPGLAGVL